MTFEKFSWENGIFYKQVIEKGHGYFRPVLESECDITISLNNQYSDLNHVCGEELNSLGIDLNNILSLKIGSPSAVAMVTIEKCIMSMREGEKSLFCFNLPKDTKIKVKGMDDEVQIQNPFVCISIHLRLVHQSTHSCNLASSEKYDLALNHKEEGRLLFPANTELAFIRFSTALKYLATIPTYSEKASTLLGLSAEEKEKYDDLKCKCFLNMAACQVKAECYEGVVQNCNQALSLQPKNIKGLYRRGKAYQAIGNLAQARSDAVKLLNIAPRNKEGIDFLNELNLK